MKPGWKALGLLAVLYYGGAKLGMLTVMPEGMAVLWLPNGIVLAALVAFRGARVAAVLAVVVATEVVADVPTFTVVEAIAFGLINFGEAALAYYLLKRLRFDPRFSSLADLWKFLVAAPLASAGCSALLGAGIYAAFRGSETGYLQFMLTWWLGDAVGLLIVAPLCFSLPPFGTAPAAPARLGRLDAAVWSATASLVAAVWLLSPRDGFAMQFLMVPLIAVVLFAAIRYGQRGAALAMLGTAAFLVLALLDARQLFGPLPPRAAVLRAQEFILLVGLLALALSSLLRQLRAQNAELEARVEERTAELRQANLRLERLARVDSLSGAANRRSFDEALAMEVARSRRYGRPLALILADLDHFKRINDTRGHAAGDAVIRSFVGVLAERARAGDLVARYGGEEFAVLLPETRGAQALQLAERVRAEQAGAGQVTASFGVAELGPQDGPQELLAAADAALYEAKAQGRNRAVLSGKSMHSLPA